MPKYTVEVKAAKKTIATQLFDLQAQVEGLTAAVKQLITVKDGRHEQLLTKIKEVSDKVGV